MIRILVYQSATHMSKPAFQITSTPIAVDDTFSSDHIGNDLVFRPDHGHGALFAGSILALAILSVLPCHQALAQSAAPGATWLDTIVVEGSSEAKIERRFQVLPGGVARIGAERFPDSANLTLSRALQQTPGVVVQDFFGGNDQPRIQVRGSGLQQNPVERGILVLQDGLPLNRADGSYVVGLVNPAQAATLEIYRGYMANRLGASVLGGAFNLVSPTGADHPGMRIGLYGGSFGQIGTSIRSGFTPSATTDALVQADYSRRDGFRDYNDSERSAFNANLGFQHSETTQTRLFFGYTDLGLQVSGPLPWSSLRDDPSQVHTGPVLGPDGMARNPGPNVIRDQPRRDTRQYRVGSRTTTEIDAHLLDVVLGYSHTDDSFRFPMAADIRSTDGGDATGVIRYAWQPDPDQILPRFEFTTQYTRGSADRTSYLNVAGQRGDLFGQNRLNADTVSAHAGFNLPLGERWTLSPATSFTRASRDNDNRYLAATRPTIAFNPGNPTQRLPDGAVPTVSTSYARNYDGWTPSLALSFQASPDQTLFAAFSRSFEPPTHDDLLATVNGTPNSSPGRPQPPNPGLAADAFRTPDLKAQTAHTFEAGWRGRRGSLYWEATAFRSEVRNELLSLRDVTGSSLGAANADRSRHTGLELGLGGRPTDWLGLELAWTWQDFHFDNDPVRGNNRLAGAPRHVLNARAELAPAASAWGLQANLHWVPERTPVDNMNTVWNDAWKVLDLRAHYAFSPAVRVFVEATNVFDETYAASTLIVDQARADQAAFIPGEGRGWFGGIELEF